MLSGISGFSYDFELYTGAENKNLLPSAPNLGMSSNVVARLSQTVPRHQNYKLFFDNWFASVELVTFLSKEGILPLDTVRQNRCKGCIFPTEKDMKKKGRGTMVEKTAVFDNVEVSVVSWYDNKLVITISSFVSSEPVGEKKRYFRKEKTHKMTLCPRSIFVHNSYMGGVDKLDAMLGFYRIKLRSKKWYMRIFYHIIDLCVVSSWLLYRRATNTDMPLLTFKIAIADYFCKVNVPKRRERPSSHTVEAEYERKKLRGPTSVTTERNTPGWCGPSSGMERK